MLDNQLQVTKMGFKNARSYEVGDLPWLEDLFDLARKQTNFLPYAHNFPVKTSWSLSELGAHNLLTKDIVNEVANTLAREEEDMIINGDRGGLLVRNWKMPEIKSNGSLIGNYSVGFRSNT